MNMKQSCKALICAIEGELDGRHCTEEQAAAILDHALPSLTEALARVEAERDALREQVIKSDAVAMANHFACDTAQAQLAEAVGLLSHSLSTIDTLPGYPCGVEIANRIESFLARHAQAVQQEAPKRGKPDWNSHSYDQIFQTSTGNWFGARAGWDFKGHISGEWKGREVSLLRDDGGFLAYGEPNPDWENSLEQRPIQEAQGAQAAVECFASPEEYAEARAALAAQPATIKLPDRKRYNGLGSSAENLASAAWNQCLDAVEKLNDVRGAEHDQ